jgi:hypothetical protein
MLGIFNPVALGVSRGALSSDPGTLRRDPEALRVDPSGASPVHLAQPSRAL